MKIDKIEFFATCDGTGIVCNIGNAYRSLTPGDTLVKHIDELILNNCPDAYNALVAIYGDDMFMRTLRFCKCNWSNNNNVPDIDNGKMHFEYVSCPMRGECRYENIICNPQIRAGLTIREYEIVKLIADGLSDFEIAQRLTIRTYTAENHRKNILSKLGLHSKAQITRWALENKICS